MRKYFTLLVILSIIFSIHACREEEQVDWESLPRLDGKEAVMIIASRDFRDEELQEPKSLLERQGAEVTVASSRTGEAVGMKGMKATPDILLDQVEVEDYDAVIFVGGSGSKEYWDDPMAHRIAQETVATGKVLAAICLAPVTLTNAGVLDGRSATVFSSEKDRLKAGGATYTGADIEVDGKIITANGPGASARFGEAIAHALAELD